MTEGFVHGSPEVDAPPEVVLTREVRRLDP
jgi:hypothetical protein